MILDIAFEILSFTAPFFVAGLIAFVLEMGTEP